MDSAIKHQSALRIQAIWRKYMDSLRPCYDCQIYMKAGSLLYEWNDPGRCADCYWTWRDLDRKPGRDQQKMFNSA